MQTQTVVRDFFKDLHSMGLTEDKLLSLDIAKRKEFFLKWKHFGSTSFNEIETTDRYFASKKKREDVLKIADEEERNYWLNFLNFEDYCTKVLRRIGVLPSDVKSDEVVQGVAKQMGGQVVAGYHRKDWDE